MGYCGQKGGSLKFASGGSEIMDGDNVQGVTEGLGVWDGQGSKIPKSSKMLSHPGLGWSHRTVETGTLLRGPECQLDEKSGNRCNAWLFWTNRMTTRFQVILKEDWESSVRVLKWESRSDWNSGRWQFWRRKWNSLPKWHESREKHVFVFCIILNKKLRH